MVIFSGIKIGSPRVFSPLSYMNIVAHNVRHVTWVRPTVTYSYMRVAEHSGVSFRTQVPLTSPPFSAIREHSDQCGAPVSSHDFKILDKNRFYTDLRILESLYIYKLKPQLNNLGSAFPLNIVGS